MNFVIFSWNFPPLNDAESYCTARFASALAQAGQQVTVVTPESSGGMNDETYSFLVSSEIHIARIPVRPVNRPNNFSRMRYLTPEWDSVNFNSAIRVLKEVLQSVKNPILVSRSSPISSHIVAWYCRACAEKWIAHFSDPYPLLCGNSTLGGIFRDFSGKHWGNKIIRDASGISITCKSVIRYFQKFYGAKINDKHLFVTTHIGEPKLPSHAKYEWNEELPLVVHAGQLNKARGVVELIAAIDKLNDINIRCTFRQIGHVADDVIQLLDNSQNCKVVTDRTPGLSSAMSEIASVCFIPDLQTGLGYSPFLPSKFAYQIFSDTPIVVYSYLGSEMHRYCEQFREAGLFFAEVNADGSLANAFQEALKCKRGDIDRAKIREVFSRLSIANKFIEDCEGLS